MGHSFLGNYWTPPLFIFQWDHYISMGAGIQKCWIFFKSYLKWRKLTIKLLKAYHEFHETCHSVAFYFMKKKTPNDDVTLQFQGQFTPKMKANPIPRLLSSLVWIDHYNQCNGMTSFMEFMLCNREKSYSQHGPYLLKITFFQVDYDAGDDWLVSQTLSTQNVEPGFFNDWFAGHLNYQIEHQWVFLWFLHV